MAMFTYTRVADRLENPVGSIASTEQEKNRENTGKENYCGHFLKWFLQDHAKLETPLEYKK